MKIQVMQHNTIVVERDENDKPVTPEPYPRPAKLAPGEYNSWRKSYSLHFDTEAQLKKAVAKVQQLGDFDKAAAWLDKQ